MSLQQTTPAYLDQCRAAQRAEQEQSMAATQQWAHVDKAQAHADFDALYKELAPLIDTNAPSSAAVQALMAKHFEIVSRFYVPSREAYVGTALFYADNADMKAFHNGYHPRMVEFLGDAVHAYAQQHLG
ncbi:TipAS antibiotic-recognition domain-containing protein [Paracidovorax valerianellae]|uniref:TipAS antibiotic-recognition domain-containing protein n=1 Tax=Paracidovorax valerianellae TaxID=187868 RepID=A0A1G6JYW9_9BURK|nr:TipAS antibiotic-recognition domain-containing protein [Paracidovorax valerianellae]MDA8445236.1 TipAS antibiotic-recognition domain-containing protein [Paracidovorax valerianellae]SDC23605.1 TipAS antibiotic-recognition domain-containing protein [Paracidovorax valerianellae]